MQCCELLEPGVRNCISKGPVSLACFLCNVKAVCNSSWLMSSQGWHSVSSYFCSPIFIHSAEGLSSLTFSNMLRQKVSVSSFFHDFSTSIYSLLRFLKNPFLLFANIWFCLQYLLLFTYLLILWAFSFNFHFEGFSYCLQILVCCCFVFLFNSLLFLGDLSVPCLLVLMPLI